MAIAPAALVGVTIASGLLGAAATQRAGQYQEIEYKERAQAETDASRDREIERRRRLVAAIASQNAETGAVHAAPGLGSVAAIAKSDARRESYESGADRAATGRRSLLLHSAGREARKQAKYSAATSLLDTGLNAAKVWPT